MAPKRSRSAESERSVSSKRLRGLPDYDTQCSLASHNVSQKGIAGRASYRGRARGRARGRQMNRRGGASACIPAVSLSAPHSSESENSKPMAMDLGPSESEDSGPMATDLGPSESEDSGPVATGLGPSNSDATCASQVALFNGPSVADRLEPNEEPTDTDKLMRVVTGALPALRGELAAHVRSLLGERDTPLAAMLRTVANFTTNVLPKLKTPANHNATKNGILRERAMNFENATKPAETAQPPVVSYLWQQSLSRRGIPNSKDTLVPGHDEHNLSTLNCNSVTHSTLHSPPRNQDPTETAYLNGDPTLQVPGKSTTQNCQPLQIKENSESHMDLDRTKSEESLFSNCLVDGPSTSNSNSISHNILHSEAINEDPTSQVTNKPASQNCLKENSESRMDLDTKHINGNLTNCNSTLQTNGDHTSNINGDPTTSNDLTKLNECPTKLNEGPTKLIEDPTKLIEDPTKLIEDPTKLIEDPTKLIKDQTKLNENPTQEDCDVKPIIKGEPIAQTSYGYSLMNDDPSDLNWDAVLLDLTFDDDIESSIRKIDDITSVHMKNLENDDDELENLFPAVAMPQKVPASNQSGKPRGVERRGRAAGRGAGRSSRGSRAPRERPGILETALTALHDVMMKGCDTLLGSSRPPAPARVFQLPKDKEEEADEEEMGVAETYAEYTPAKLNIGCRHPDPVVETASLSSVESADVTYKLSLPDDTIRGGLLSALQLEAVVYASQAHEHMLPDGTRAGFLIGDGAGVGKGRTIAGIIFENHLKGRKRAVWVSVSNDLKYDAERDLRDIGAGRIQVHPLNKMNYSSISSATNGRVTEGVVFSTYSALIGYTAAAGAEHNTRLKQLLAWCGPDFDGCIVFDECHRAKNLCPVTATKPSKTGLAVLNLQHDLPKARLVYASATGASEPKNMAYMVRLGIWGEGTPFPSFKDFLVAVERRGVGAMEIVAMDMKLRGMYIARQLSFHGVTFKIEEVPLSLAFRETYDKAVELWVEAMQTFQEGLELVNPSHKFRKVMWGQFWGAHQRFFKYLCIAAKVSRTVCRSREAVEAGKCAVIGLQSTGEARTLDQLEKDDGKLTEFICTAKGVFQSLVEKQFPDPAVIKDEECPPASPEVRQQAKEMKDDLLNKIAQLGKQLPPNTLDQLVDQLGGAENVAEMTGRKGRVVQTSTGRIQYESRSDGDVPLETLNLTEKQRFMDGEKNIAIISEAASSGISLQSDKRVKNHRRRVHITLELPWSADRAIQQFGRTHRSNQVNAPEYIFLISDLAGERRFASTVAKRLESLGALTHGDRRATETRDLSQFNIENKYGRAALKRISRAVNGLEPPLVEPPRGYAGDFLRDAAAALEDVGMNIRNEQESSVDIQRFLNRLLGVPVQLQNALFQHFSDTFAAILYQAKRSGRFDLGILDLGSAGESVRRVRCVRILRAHATGSAPVELHTVLSERGLDWDKADRKFSELTDPGEGFYLSRARWNNNYNAILCVASNVDTNRNVAARNKMYNIYRPNLGLQLRPEPLADINKKYVKSSRVAAMAPWKAQYEQSLTVCTHAYWHGTCGTAGCEVGLRVRTYHVLSGSVLSVWARLEAVMKRLHLANRMQVVRVKTDQGLKIVGTLLPKYCVDSLVEELKSDALSFSDQTF